MREEEFVKLEKMGPAVYPQVRVYRTQTQSNGGKRLLYYFALLITELEQKLSLSNITKL